MPELTFPSDFLWGAATAGHQVEGDNTNSDWWAWEQQPGSPVAEPSGGACEHYTRYRDDIALLADAGLNTYRYSIEWSRVEPEEGTYDADALAHYRQVTQAVVDAGVTPMVTLNHFTVPQWFAARGGWMARDAADAFGRYCEQVVRAIGELVPWWCTLNEPGNVAVGGYLGALGWPPGTQSFSDWKRATRGLTAAHTRSLAVVKSLHPDAKVGATHGMIEWLPSPPARPAVEQVRRLFEDAFLEVCGDDDYIGVQSYTRLPVPLPTVVGPAVRAAMAVPPVRERVLPMLIRQSTRQFGSAPAADDGIRRTQMGYEFWPEAIAATLRRAAELHPGKDLVVTEHGIATDDDAERIEFVTRGLAAVRAVMDEGLAVRGYVYWSLLDNFEWTLGYRPTFGLIGVDRATQQRTVRPSARFLGEVARTGRLRTTAGQ
jgi:beta-glucosidase